MNLAEHFIFDEHAFTTYEELGLFCEKHCITSADDKRELLDCLITNGAKKGWSKWMGKELAKQTLVGVGLRDFSLACDKDSYGKGVHVWEIK